ncbi:metal ABC transporter substrate-binding protein [Subtercola lobariae]|uniref:Metal ABC transporter substrate-binding protein n=1 Tax=Subtercola lobariae TaxID=1588641 RepID=A0A917EZJ9_9MICO|nr:metal ABC transporter substrate-binding protein [Subtercola lobariae]
MHARRSLLGVALAGFLVAAASGCAADTATADGAQVGSSSSQGSSGQPGVAGGSLRIVASTSVYGDIAESIGGDRVSVTSIIDNPDKDPHEYQATGQNALALSKASIVIENGGGYDDFIDSMLSTAKKPGAIVVNAATISGYDQHPADGSFNEHLWYDFATVSKVADELAGALTTEDPRGAAFYQANALDFSQKLDALTAREKQLQSLYAGTGVAITEPVALYLLDAVGLVDKTPAKFSEAVENGTDVAPDVLSQTIAPFADHRVAALVYNSQTTGAQTDAVLGAAHAASVPVVAVTESLPAGQSYLGWMTDNLAALGAALSQ